MIKKQMGIDRCPGCSGLLVIKVVPIHGEFLACNNCGWATCPRCRVVSVSIEWHWSGGWYNCYICGWEFPVEGISKDKIKEEIETEEGVVRRVGRQPSTRGVRL